MYAGQSGSNEQIFGADKQVSAGLVQKMHSGRENPVRAMLMAGAAVRSEGGIMKSVPLGIAVGWWRRRQKIG
jgi:hypothetical protein